MANTHTDLPSLFTDLATAIREKTGNAEQIIADDIPSAIDALPVPPPDGKVWTKATLLREIEIYTIHRIVYAGSKFFICCDGVLVSDDGVTFRDTDIDIVECCVVGVACGNGKYVAICDDGDIFVSNDGEEWTEAGDAYLVDNLRAIAYGNGIFIAVGYERVTRDGQIVYLPKVIISSDGDGWEEASFVSQLSDQGFGILFDVVFGDGVFVIFPTYAVSGIYRTILTTDGRTLSGYGAIEGPNPSPYTFDYVVATYADGRFIFCHDGELIRKDKYIFQSADGITWSQLPTGETGITVPFYGNGKLMLASVWDTALRYSTDWQTWKKTKSLPLAEGDKIATATWGRGIFVLGTTNGEVYYSRTTNDY